MQEIAELHRRLIDNLRLGMGVFLNGTVRDAQRLLEEKAASGISSGPLPPPTWRGCRSTPFKA